MRNKQRWILSNIEAAISGSGNKTPSESEARNIEIVRKSLHLNKDLKKGTVISSNDLIVLRPTGIHNANRRDYRQKQ